MPSGVQAGVGGEGDVGVGGRNIALVRGCSFYD